MDATKRLAILAVFIVLAGLTCVSGQSTTTEDGLAHCYTNDSLHKPDGINFTCPTDCCPSNETFCCTGEECCTGSGIIEHVLSPGQFIAIAVTLIFLVICAVGVLVWRKTRSYRPHYGGRNVEQCGEDDLVPEHEGYDQPGARRGGSRY